jgi:hypothetical protein
MVELGKSVRHFFKKLIIYKAHIKKHIVTNNYFFLIDNFLNYITESDFMIDQFIDFFLLHLFRLIIHLINFEFVINFKY